MVLRAARDSISTSRGLTPSRSMVGRPAGATDGGRGILVRTGYGTAEEDRPIDGVDAAPIVDTLLDAATWILLQERAAAVART